MTPRKGLYVALGGLVIVGVSLVPLLLQVASGQDPNVKPAVQGKLLLLGGGFGLIVMVVGLMVAGTFLARVVGILIGAIVVFSAVAIAFLILESTFVRSGFHKEGPIAWAILAAIGWLLFASIYWGKIRKAPKQGGDHLHGGIPSAAEDPVF